MQNHTETVTPGVNTLLFGSLDNKNLSLEPLG